MAKHHYMSFINNPNCPLLDYIKTGKKTVEGRLHTGNYLNIHENDIIIFKTRGEDDVYVKVVYVHKYKTLEDYLKNETVERALPCVSSLDEGVRIYNKWSSKEQRDRLLNETGYSFIGFGIELLNEKDMENLRRYLKYKKKYNNLKRSLRN